MTDALLTTKQAALYLNYELRTLEGWRARGVGPPYIKVNARSFRYRLTDLEDWLSLCRISPENQAPPA